MLNFRIDRITSDLSQCYNGKTREIVLKIVAAVFSRRGHRIPDNMRNDALLLAVAWHSYIPIAYHGDLLLLNAVERQPEYENDRTLGWKTCTTGAITVHIVPGSHKSVVYSPHVRALVERLTPYLSPQRAVN